VIASEASWRAPSGAEICFATVRGTEEKVKNDNRFGFSGMTGKRLQHKDPVLGYTHRVQRRNQLTHETRFIVTSARGAAQKMTKP
jgi:hypothetical protein